MGFIQPFDRPDRVGQGTAGEGVAVDADGNVFAAEDLTLSWAAGFYQVRNSLSDTRLEKACSMSGLFSERIS